LRCDSFPPAVGSDRKSVEIPSPAIPSGNYRRNDPAADIGDYQRILVDVEETGNTF
jgi:hypothetical protein